MYGVWNLRNIAITDTITQGEQQWSSSLIS
jgi:hypothetical protein